MAIGDAFGWLLLVALGWLGLVGWWLVARGLWPAATGRARDRYRRPARTTLVGLAASAPAIVLAFALGKGAPALASALLMAVVLVGLIGSAGLAEAVAEHLADDAAPARRFRAGAIALALACLAPFVGWFVLLPWLLVSGVGAALGARRDRS